MITRQCVDLEPYLKLLERLNEAEVKNQALQKQLEAMHARQKGNIDIMRRINSDLKLLEQELCGRLIKTDPTRVNAGRNSRYPARSINSPC